MMTRPRKRQVVAMLRVGCAFSSPGSCTCKVMEDIARVCRDVNMQRPTQRLWNGMIKVGQEFLDIDKEETGKELGW